jgi:hypothetical protein
MTAGNGSSGILRWCPRKKPMLLKCLYSSPRRCQAASEVQFSYLMHILDFRRTTGERSASHCWIRQRSALVLRFLDSSRPIFSWLRRTLQALDQSISSGLELRFGESKNSALEDWSPRHRHPSSSTGQAVTVTKPNRKPNRGECATTD